MAWTTTIGDKFSTNLYWPLVASTITNEANFLAVLNGMPTDKPGYHWNREQDANLDQGGWIDCATNATSLTMDPDEFSVALKQQVLATEICDISNQYSNPTEQLGAQIKNLLRKAGRAIEYTLINGVGTGNIPKGLKTWVSSGQTIDNASVTLTFAALDALISKVPVRGLASNHVFVTNKAIIDKVRALLRGTGAFYPENNLPAGFSDVSYRGFRFVSSDYVELNDSGATGSIYFVNIEFPTDGFGMILGVANQSLSRFVEADMGPFRLINAGHDPLKPKVYYQLQARMAFALGSDKAAARLKAVPTT